MHVVSEQALASLGLETDVWRVSETKLESMAGIVLGGAGPHVRWPGRPALVVRTRNGVFLQAIERGSEAGRIPEELDLLNAEVRRCVGRGKHASQVVAAAGGHLRFAAIHPLCDGNGRVGRVLLARQCAWIFAVDAKNALRCLEHRPQFYRSLFRDVLPEFRLQALTDHLESLFGCGAPIRAADHPFEWAPRYPDRAPLPESAEEHAVQVTCSLSDEPPR